MNQNFIEQLFIDSINIMATGEWEWPNYWDKHRRMHFLNESLRYAEERELYEQCAIIRDVKTAVDEI
jgi:hypothetical protein